MTQPTYNDKTTCYNCKNLELSGTQQPCKYCINQDGTYPKFEKKV